MTERDRLLDHVRHLTAVLVAPARFADLRPVELRARRLRGEPVPYREAIGGEWSRFSVGDSWGGTWDTWWFRLGATIPRSWSEQRVDLLLDLGFDGNPGFGAEGQLWRDGTPLWGVNQPHPEVPVADPAAGGEELEFYLEAAANPRVVGERLLLPEYGDGTELVFRRAELGVRDLEVDALYLDLLVLTELAAALPGSDRRTWEVLNALRSGCAAIDPHGVSASAPAARAELAPALAVGAPTSAHRVSAIGHAHIDSAWLWPVRETIRKCARTFSTALALLERDPNYVFSCSQAQQHAWMRDRYPQLFERMVAQAGNRRFEPIGSMWVEPDCNIPSGESLVRQFLHGKRFFLEHYGVETVDCWLPDAFGYPASLPQIMAKAGIRAFISQKLSWNEENRLPHHTFRWEGIDGTGVLAHFPPADTYNGQFSASELRYSERNFRDHGASGLSAYPYGNGDGGGGPTEEMLQRARRMGDLQGLPRTQQETVRAFVQRLEQENPKLSTWADELYLEFHRGVFTSQARTKQANRRCEQALYEAELWSSGMGDPEAREELTGPWQSLLLNQFHDILPGSSINWVYQDTARDHAAVLECAEAVRRRALEALADSVPTAGTGQPVLVMNACSHPRREILQLAPRITRLVEVPSCGWAVYDLDTATETLPAVEASANSLENELVRVAFDASGVIISLWDKTVGREVVAPGQAANALVLFDDRPSKWDAWELEEFYPDRSETLCADSVEVLDQPGPGGAVRFHYSFGSSQLTQTVRLQPQSARFDFETQVDWQERHRLLKSLFPVEVLARRASFEIQFGLIERATHANTSWERARFETCAHRWADLSEEGYGVALLNDAKYGYHVHGNTLELSLLRGPTEPDPEADLGAHHFTYSLLPHAGGVRDGGVVEAGLDLNAPLQVMALPTGQPGNRPARGSLVAFHRPGVVLAALKRAEDSDDLVLRCYEAHGARGPVSILLGLPVHQAWTTDLLERPEAPIEVHPSPEGTTRIDLNIGPFELVTIRLGLAAGAPG